MASADVDIEEGGERMSDEAVRTKTGKDWNGWFSILDGAGAASMSHKEIVAILADHGVGPWWRQMVTVTYEKARGLRRKHQMTDGYQISRSKTIAAPVGKIFALVSDGRKLESLLSRKGLEMRKANPDKTVRLALADGTPVEFYFYPKGDDKTAVTVQHSKLPDAESAARMKEYWGEKLDLMKEKLEG